MNFASCGSVWTTPTRLVCAARVGATVLLTAGSIAGPAQARSHRQASRAERQLKLVRHQREDARLSAALARATHAQAAHKSGPTRRRPRRSSAVTCSSPAAAPSRSTRPSGQLVHTVAATTGAGPICFDPSGAHLIAPGVGVFNSSGKLQKSKWSSIAITP